MAQQKGSTSWGRENRRDTWCVAMQLGILVVMGILCFRDARSLGHGRLGAPKRVTGRRPGAAIGPFRPVAFGVDAVVASALAMPLVARVTSTSTSCAESLPKSATTGLGVPVLDRGLAVVGRYPRPRAVPSLDGVDILTPARLRFGPRPRSDTRTLAHTIAFSGERLLYKAHYFVPGKFAPPHAHACIRV